MTTIFERARRAGLALGAPLLALSAAAPAAGQAGADSGAFVVRLGHDTVGVERYVRRGDTLRAVSVTRSPSTAVRTYTVVLGPEGRAASFASGRPDQTPELAPVQPAGAIPLAGAFFVPFELAVQQARAAEADSVRIVFVSGREEIPVVARRTGEDTWQLPNQFGVLLTVSVDAQGRVRSIESAGGGNTVERVPSLDVDALAREFRARDEAGRGLGPLSPRDSVSATVKGAHVTVAYGRPSLRGRPLDVLVPPGQVWRTGANVATHLTTDRELRFGSLVVPAGTYTLFTLPSPSGWTLIINRQTGQSGLEYDEARDLGRVELTTARAAPHTERFTIDVEETAQGGVLALRWGTVRASAAFTLAGGGGPSGRAVPAR